MQDGNLCIGTLENNTCTGEILKIEMDGEVPKEGTIRIKDGEIKHINLALSNKEIWIDPFTEEIAYKLAPGLYDKNDKLLASWDELNRISLETTDNKFDFKEIIEIGMDCIIYESGDEFCLYATTIFETIGDAYKLVIDKSVTSIGERAFFECEGLKEIIIPSSVTSIGANAFSSVDLTTIYYKGTATGASWGASKATIITDF